MLLTDGGRALLLASLAAAAVIRPDNTNDLRASYDYIVVGGGASGLTVANRLSEDSSVNVLAIEAGSLDDGSATVMAPGSIATTSFRKFNWNYRTVPQTFIDGKDRDYPLGKVVGGGTILNGIAWTRAAAAGYDAWADLGNEGWGWDDLLPYFKKAKIYRPQNYPGRTNYGKNTLNVNPDLEFREFAKRPVTQRNKIKLTHALLPCKDGTGGPVQVGYPEFFYSQSEYFLDGAKALGIPRVGDLNTGNTTGAAIIPSSMTLKKQSRASARSSCLDPVVVRENLHVAVEQRVTRILLDGTPQPKATGVEFSRDAGSPKRTVKASREVILAAGAIFSPVLLQVSGIGPRAVLDSIGVKTRVNLPGVGNNLQDHPMVAPAYKCPYTCPMVNAVAFPPFSLVTADYADLLDSARSRAMSLPTDDESLRRGYGAQRRAILDLLELDSVGAFELWSSSAGDVTVSLMQPLSRGNVTAPSADVFDAPRIDPRFCSHPFDCEILELGVGFIARLAGTEAMRPLAPAPLPGFAPGEDVRGAVNGQAADLIKQDASDFDRVFGNVLDIWGE
ncbi:hypothetical protein N3K66_006145 [Trichothecium roseum]|uniref:Uncharacterized protein n=1 Tax=Trichothecium roseum TaxID=47278 RepID=A0ACC0UZV6_9HYPO|nr:hypothetical protein N3K66_006145 [Trichothecium roseum]